MDKITLDEMAREKFKEAHTLKAKSNRLFAEGYALRDYERKMKGKPDVKRKND